MHFLANFWPSFGPPLGVSLGVSWEPSRASWGSLGRPLDPKTLKNCWFFKVFENAAFWLFEAPDGSLGLILPPLWPIWSQNGPQNYSQKCSKKEPTNIQFFCFLIFCKIVLTKILNHLKANFETQFGPAFLHKIRNRFTRETKMSPRGPSLALKSQQLPLKNLKKPNGF